tara:strand:- start:1551 stop:1814 length:264 start_codon:yes stop_codon:yes gene_type:complete
MTTLTQTWGYTCSFCNKVASLILNSFIATLFAGIIGYSKAIGQAICVSRQIEANQKLAHLLRHEYPYEDYAGILAILNDKTLKEYYR